MKCLICGRKLKSQLSIERGIGPGCWKKNHTELHNIVESSKKDEDIPGQMSIDEFID